MSSLESPSSFCVRVQDARLSVSQVCWTSEALRWAKWGGQAAAVEEAGGPGDASVQMWEARG